ncbi:hypothetical protein V5N11_014346 [Cardamine amara subsp. amara]|uniref:Retrotransposon gag domain-containing protein n=1 Tax=Cardamine amara subsp. amara TaxID=228776 RepID=A0ABD1A9E2_CARAN
MLNRKTRSNKNLPLVNLWNQELAELIRRNRRNQNSAKMLRTIIRPDEAGVLRDGEGLAYNDAGQRIDEHGQLIEEVVQDAGVDRHQAGGVDRHQQAAVDNNVVQGAAGAVVQRGITLGEYNRPEQFYANRCAIRPPLFQRNDFELKPAYYTLVGQYPFHGLSHEHPMDHIEKFEDLLKPGSLTTWEDTKNAFLSNFYDDARSEELRMKISTFSQGPIEAFKTAWARFRAYQRDCPHHGFSEVQLLGIFFRGIDWRYQMALDAASNGNFNTRYPEDAVVLIENLASSNSTKNADFERKKQAWN